MVDSLVPIFNVLLTLVNHVPCELLSRRDHDRITGNLNQNKTLLYTSRQFVEPPISKVFFTQIKIISNKFSSCFTHQAPSSGP